MNRRDVFKVALGGILSPLAVKTASANGDTQPYISRVAKSPESYAVKVGESPISETRRSYDGLPMRSTMTSFGDDFVEYEFEVLYPDHQRFENGVVYRDIYVIRDSWRDTLASADAAYEKMWQVAQKDYENMVTVRDGGYSYGNLVPSPFTISGGRRVHFEHLATMGNTISFKMFVRTDKYQAIKTLHQYNFGIHHDMVRGDRFDGFNKAFSMWKPVVRRMW